MNSTLSCSSLLGVLYFLLALQLWHYIQFLLNVQYRKYSKAITPKIISGKGKFISWARTPSPEVTVIIFNDANTSINKNQRNYEYFVYMDGIAWLYHSMQQTIPFEENKYNRMCYHFHLEKYKHDF